MNKTLWAHAAILAANIIYGLNYRIAKEVMPEYIGPYGFILLRIAVSLLLFALVNPLFGNDKVAKADYLRLFLCGLFGIAANQLLFFGGLSLTSPIDASIIMISTPILVLLVAFVLAGEKLTPLRGAGIAIGAGGAALLLLVNPTNATAQGSSLLGNVMILVNALSYGIYLVIAKPLMQKYNPITVLKWSFFFGLIISIPFGYNQVATPNYASFSTNVWLGVGFVIICATFLAYLFNNFALRYVSPAIVGVYIYLQPLLAAIVEVILGHQAPTPAKIAAAALIVLGVYLVSKQQASAQKL